MAGADEAYRDKQVAEGILYTRHGRFTTTVEIKSCSPGAEGIRRQNHYVIGNYANVPLRFVRLHAESKRVARFSKHVESSSGRQLVVLDHIDLSKGLLKAMDLCIGLVSGAISEEQRSRFSDIAENLRSDLVASENFLDPIKPSNDGSDNSDYAVLELMRKMIKSLVQLLDSRGEASSTSVLDFQRSKRPPEVELAFVFETLERMDHILEGLQRGWRPIMVELGTPLGPDPDSLGPIIKGKRRSRASMPSDENFTGRIDGEFLENPSVTNLVHYCRTDGNMDDPHRALDHIPAPPGCSKACQWAPWRRGPFGRFLALGLMGVSKRRFLLDAPQGADSYTVRLLVPDEFSTPRVTWGGWRLFQKDSRNLGIPRMRAKLPSQGPSHLGGIDFTKRSGDEYVAHYQNECRAVFRPKMIEKWESLLKEKLEERNMTECGKSPHSDYWVHAAKHAFVPDVRMRVNWPISFGSGLAGIVFIVLLSLYSVSKWSVAVGNWLELVLYVAGPAFVAFWIGGSRPFREFLVARGLLVALLSLMAVLVSRIWASN